MRARQLLADAEKKSGLIIADISLWKIAMLVAKGRITLRPSPAEFLETYVQAYDVTVQPITAEIAEKAVYWPKEVNGDPADQIIAAMSSCLGVPLLTADRNLQKAQGINTIW